MKSTWPCRAKISMTRATIGLPQTGIIGLGMYSVKGEARVPRPPAKITTFTGGPTLLEQQVARLYHARLEPPGESLVAHVQRPSRPAYDFRGWKSYREPPWLK